MRIIMGDDVDCVPAQLAFGEEKEDVVLNLLGREQIGRAVKVLGQSGDRLQIGLLRGGGEAAQLHVADHPVA
jgi:hypothetical protein